MDKREMLNKKNCIVIAIIILIGVAAFCITYAVKSASIDDEVSSNSFSDKDVVDYDNSIIKDIKPTIDGVKYDSIQQLIGVVNEPIVCDVEVTYTTTDEPATFEAYVSFNSDETVKEATYTSGDYFQIILPSLKSTDDDKSSVGSNSIPSTEN